MSSELEPVVLEVDAPKANTFSFQPPSGGDVTLKSSDGTTFVAHSLLLGLASKVFSDMLSTTSIADVVELSEDSEAISLMLAFIYQVMRPPIQSITLLEKSMLVAHKYEIDGLAQTLENACTQQRPLICRDPVRIFRAAVDYGFRETQKVAALLLSTSELDLLQVAGIVEVAKMFPHSAHIIGAVGARGARIRILDSLLLSSGSHKRLTWAATSLLVCPSCRKNWASLVHEDKSYYYTGWLTVWAKRLHSELMFKTLDDCGSFFQIEYISSLKAYNGCSSCIDLAFAHRSSFREWSIMTYRHVDRELSALDVLYQL